MKFIPAIGYALLALLLASCGEGQMIYGQVQHDRLLLTATANELIRQVAVSKGQSVKVGDLLLQLDDTVQLQKVAQADAELQQRQAALELLQHGARNEQRAAATARLNSAKARARDASQQYQRAVRLKAQNLLAQASLDQAKAAHDAAQAAVEDASQQLAELTNGSRSEQIRQAEAAVAAAQAVLAQEEKRLADLSIRASRAGLVDDLPYQQGERVPLGAPVVVLQAEGTAYARLYVPSTMLSQLSLGQTIMLQADQLASPLQGSLRQIHAQPVFTPYYALNQEDRAQLMVLVEVALPASAQQLPSGLPVQWSQP